jgi:hypothetical protein
MRLKRVCKLDSLFLHPFPFWTSHTAQDALFAGFAINPAFALVAIKPSTQSSFFFKIKGAF